MTAWSTGDLEAFQRWFDAAERKGQHWQRHRRSVCGSLFTPLQAVIIGYNLMSVVWPVMGNINPCTSQGQDQKKRLLRIYATPRTTWNIRKHEKSYCMFFCVNLLSLSAWLPQQLRSPMLFTTVGDVPLFLNKQLRGQILGHLTMQPSIDQNGSCNQDTQRWNTAPPCHGSHEIQLFSRF